MNRPIKFRFWSKVTNRMSPAVPLEMICYESFDESIKSMSDKYIVFMQFTGQLDKNDVEIYEGDILKFAVKSKYGLVQMVGSLVYNKNRMQFGIDARTEFEIQDAQEDGAVEIKESELGLPEVIGNIYQNPELLKSK